LNASERGSFQPGIAGSTANVGRAGNEVHSAVVVLTREESRTGSRRSSVPTTKLPSFNTHKYQPLRPVSTTREGSDFTFHRRANFQQGCRGWLTSKAISPAFPLEAIRLQYELE